MKKKVFLATMILSLTMCTASVAWAGDVGLEAAEGEVEFQAGDEIVAFDSGETPEPLAEEVQGWETETFSDGVISWESRDETFSTNEIKELESGNIELNGVIYHYEQETDSYTVMGGTGQKVIELPIDINGKEITAIAPKAFTKIQHWNI